MRIFQPTVTGSNTTTGSLHISGPVYFYTLETSSVSHVLTYNTASGQVFFTASDAFKGVPDDPPNSIQFNHSGSFSGSANLTFDNNVVYLTGSLNTTGSITLTGSMFVSGAISASFGPNTVGFYGTASWAQSASNALFAQTASFITASNVWGPFGSSSVQSASYASSSTSASFAATASFSFSASFAATAAAAPEDTWIQYNRLGLFGAEQYFRYIYNSHSFQQGNNVTASGDYSHAEGGGTQAINTGAHAEGADTQAAGQYSHAEGAATQTIGNFSHAEGLFSTSSGDYSHAEGVQTQAIGNYSHAEGVQTQTLGQYSHAEGYLTTSSGQYSHTEGYQTFASGSSSHAEGYQTFASGSSSHAEGRETSASGDYSHAEGVQTKAIGNYSHAEGGNTQAIGSHSHTEGTQTKAIGLYSHAEGANTLASGSYSHAEGYLTTASGLNSHAEGTSTQAIGNYSHAEGNSSKAIGFTSHAEGELSQAIGQSSHAEGYFTTASGLHSHTEGRDTKAVGDGSHTEGFQTISGFKGFTATANFTDTITISNQGDLTSIFTSNQLVIDSLGLVNYISTNYSNPNFTITLSYVINKGGTIYVADLSDLNNSLASNNAGPYSHAEGYKTTALGLSSHAGGENSLAIGKGSLTHGYNVTSSANYQTSIGQYNVANTSQSAFIIGDGTADNARHNVLFVSKSWFEASASNTFFQGLPETSSNFVLVYNTASGQVFFTASDAVGGTGKPAPQDTWIQYNENDEFGAEEYFRYIYTSHSLEQGDLNQAIGVWSHAQGSNTQAIGQYSHTEGANTYTGTLLGYSASIASGIVTLYAGYGNITTEFNAGDYLWFTDDDHPDVILIDSVTYINPNTVITLSNLSFNKSSCVVGNASIRPSLWSGGEKMGASHAHAEGEETYAIGKGSHAEGYLTVAVNSHSHVEGVGTYTYGAGSHAEGEETISKGYASHTEGYRTTASGDYSHAEGTSTQTIGQASHAEGLDTTASGDYSHTEGNGSETIGGSLYSHAEGYFTKTTANSAHAEGYETTAGNLAAHSEGYKTIALGNYSHAEGSGSMALGVASHVEGNNNTASGDYQLVIGQYNKVLPSQSSFIIGDGTANNARHNVLFVSKSWFEASASNVYFQGLPQTSSNSVLVYDSSSGRVFFTASNAVGGGGTPTPPAPEDTWIQYNQGGVFGATGSFRFIYTSQSLQQGNTVTASGYWSHAQGSSSLASGIGSHAEGYLTTSSGNYSHAEGFNNTSSGNYSHAEGERTLTLGSSSHAEGYRTLASGNYSHAEGNGTISEGLESHAEGSNTIAKGARSHAEGRSTLALGSYSHAEGYLTTSSGQYSHAEGYQTIASGTYSHAEGSASVALGIASHTEGLFTIASGSFQTVVGQYNVALPSQSAFIIGDGFITSSIIDSDTLQGGTEIGEDIFVIDDNVSPTSALIGGTLTVTGASGTEIFTILSVTPGLGVYQVRVTPNAAQKFNSPNPYTITVPVIERHNLLFASQSWFDVSASNVFLRGIPSSFEPHILSYHSESGQVYYMPTFSLSPAPEDTWIQYNSGSKFGATGSFRFIYTSQSLQQGNEVTASGYWSHAEGSSSYAFGTGSHAEGLGTTASGDYSHTEGRGAKAIGESSHAEGNQTISFGGASHAEGYQTIASGSSAHAEGSNTVALNLSSHAEGSGSVASGSYSHAEGRETIASGESSHAEGYQTLASGAYSHAEGSSDKGSYVIAYGYASHAEGLKTEARGTGSHAEGSGTIALGEFSHAEGNSNQAIGSGSHAAGDSSYAYADYSSVAGLSLISSGNYQFVVGQYNVANTSQSAFIIGDGDNLSGVHNVLFASRSHFEVSASNTFLQGLPTSPELHVLAYNTSSGQVYYTASSAIGGGGGLPAPSDTYIQYNENDEFGAEEYFRYVYTSHSFEQGLNVAAIGQYSHAGGNETYAIGAYSCTGGDSTYAGTLLGYSASIASGIVTLYAGYDDVTSEFNAGDYLWFTDFPSTNVVLIDSVTYTNPNTVITLDNSSINETSTVIGNASIHPSLWSGDKKAGGSSAHTEGGATYALGGGSHAEGNSTATLGNHSHSEGKDTKTLGDCSHAEGSSSVAIGAASHAEGYLTTASGKFSHAEGRNTIASGFGSHAEGRNTKALGDYSHAEGSGSFVQGNYSHAVGRNTYVKNDYSYAAGYSSSATGDYQHVIGQYNVANTSQSAFIIGDGDNNSNRHNVLFISKSYFEADAPNVYLKNLPSQTQNNLLNYNSTTGKVTYSSNSQPATYKALFTCSAGINPSVAELTNTLGATLTWTNTGPNDYITIAADANIFTGRVYWDIHLVSSSGDPLIGYLRRDPDQNNPNVPNEIYLYPYNLKGTKDFNIGLGSVANNANSQLWGTIVITIHPES